MEGKPEQGSPCKKGFLKNSVMKGHMLKNTDEKSFKCSQYQKSFIQHCNLICAGEKLNECSQCLKIFPKRSALLRHMIAHTDEKPYECSHCQKTFKWRNSLRQHMIIHTGEKRYGCSYCQKTFSKKSYLVQHMSIHTGEKPHKCSQCQKTFSRRANLLQHMTLHTGEKPHKCSQCQKTFSRRGYLVQHMTLHTGEKPFVCSHCLKAFNRKNTLTQHMNIHTGQKPPECSQCKTIFSLRKHLIQHIELHKQERSFSSVHSEWGFQYKAGQNCHTSCQSNGHCDRVMPCQQDYDGHLMSHLTVMKDDRLQGMKQEAGNDAQSFIRITDTNLELSQIIPESPLKSEIDSIDLVKEEF